MAAGKPVIALSRGGTAETVIEGVTGEFFEKATTELIADAIGRFKANEDTYDYLKIRRRAEDFSRDIFKVKMTEFIDGVIK
jgi:glycosyltransferase involved in cell wall biosynthesis